MEITVNGEKQTAAPGTIGDFLRSRDLAPQGLVVEHNRRVVAPQQWEETALAENDNLEILSFVGGG